MKLKDLIKLPEKLSTKDYYLYTEGQTNSIAFNRAIDQVGNIEVELDVDKIIEILRETIVHKYDAKIDIGSDVTDLAQAIADKHKEIIKK